MACIRADFLAGNIILAPGRLHSPCFGAGRLLCSFFFSAQDGRLVYSNETPIKDDLIRVLDKTIMIGKVKGGLLGIGEDLFF